jgi:hypothetical protein
MNGWMSKLLNDLVINVLGGTEGFDVNLFMFPTHKVELLAT